NGAWRQRQLDVYGELLSAAHRLSDRLFDPGALPVTSMVVDDRWHASRTLASGTRRFLVDLADTAARRWQEQDHGIWEVRGEPRHFVYSKLMCWVALERATALAEALGAADRVPTWMRTSGEIRRAI